MNRHQVLTGAVNSGDGCYAVGTVENVHFTAYAAGCDIVILASDFQRIQIIPGATLGNVQIGCIDCCDDTGKIAASYGPSLCIFEPTPLLHSDSTHKLDYQWYRTGTIVAEADVVTLAFNNDGSKLLTGGDIIQMWKAPDATDGENAEEGGGEGVSFQLGGDADDMTQTEWDCVWQCRLANPVYQMKFSPDGSLFATIGKNDRLVKIWYENKKVLLPMSRSDSFSPRRDEVTYMFIYVAHPRSVTGLSWRKTSRYMPKSSVANALITSCKDSICRIWCETVIPDDGLIDTQQLDLYSPQDQRFHTARHRTRFMQTLNHIKRSAGARTRRLSSHMLPQGAPIPTAPQFLSMRDMHEAHRLGTSPEGLNMVLHFHLAASINPETDIPLLPTIGANANTSGFDVHWMNNKELHFTLEAGRIIYELSDRSVSEAALLTDEDDETMEDDGQAADLLQNGDDRADVVPIIDRGLGHGSDSEESQKSDPTSRSTMTNGHVVPEKKAGDKGVCSPLEKRIERLLRDWHQCPDVVFMVHPSDGSFLVWLVEWLDEYMPCSFRQAQVSFSSRIPHCFPVGDATTMSTNIKLYSNYIKKSTIQGLDNAGCGSTAHAMGKNSPGQSGNTFMPNVILLSKHSNGSLNQWQISFAEHSKFSQVLSVAHASRACGHRFRTNNAACHPVLPLLLSTSHHNLPDVLDESTSSSLPRSPSLSSWCDAAGFCSELILWKVDPVGPLSKSGGITELSRINSSQLSAFSNVSWLPTLLPSSTLGNASNSPSALFIASDGRSLRIYQAVIDARTLLHDVTTSATRKKQTGSTSSRSSGYEEKCAQTTDNVMIGADDRMLNVVSLQSTSRPGCIIELDAIADAKQDWQHTQFLHIYQEQMIVGRNLASCRLAEGQSRLEAVVDLRNTTVFEEHFYLVVIEKMNTGGSVLHMWRIVIASNAECCSAEGALDPEFGDDDGDDVDGYTCHGDSEDEDLDYLTQQHQQKSQSQDKLPLHLRISTNKLCSQQLELPPGAEVVSTAVSAGHLSSSSIYPACFAPYLFSTACSDGVVRFWKCHVTTSDDKQTQKFVWMEWDMMIASNDSSSIRLPGTLIGISCAYSGRIAVAYRMGRVRSNTDNPENKFVNLYVSIYECESTGGSEWTMEDTIELKNINIPDLRAEINLNVISNPNLRSPDSPTKSPMGRSLSIPSLSTIFTVRKLISERGNKDGRLTQKQLIQMDWVSTEDGSHILTVGVGTKVIMFAPVSTEIAMATKREMNVNQSARRPRPMLQKTKSMTVPNVVEEIRWMKMRSIELTSADGLPPLPMHVSWARDGILVVGLDNEMHVYSQWKGTDDTSNDTVSENELTNSGGSDHRNITDLHVISSCSNLSNLMKRNASLLKVSQSSCSLVKLSDAKTKDPKRKSLAKSDSTVSLQFIQDCGLFEAARLANPVLPQYHPKQLLELLNFGKIRRVKAILSHLTRCIAGSQSFKENFVHAKARRMSLSAPTNSQANTIQEEVLDYVEINSIPPLPLYALLAADQDSSLVQETKASSPFGGAGGGLDPDYSALFTTGFSQSSAEDAHDEIDDEEDDVFDEHSNVVQSPKRKRLNSGSQSATNPNYFGPSQSRMLCNHLTYTHLPGLSRLDQMYLLALADTVANTTTDFSDRFAPDRAVKNLVQSHDQRQQAGTGTFGAGTGGYAEAGGAGSGTTDSIDDCGLRYMLAMRHFIYLMRTLPIRQRAQLQVQGLSSAYLVWAFHSEAEEELLSFIPSLRKGDPVWAELKQFGAGWWVRNDNILRRVIEKVAKTAFQLRKDPLDAALFYLAMKKKNLLSGLFRSVQDTKMNEFMRNDFTQDRWRRAALKNAFALLGKQRFEHATAFFLLAGAVRDAIEVCLNKLEDVQLAMIIARLYEGNLDEPMPLNLRRILYEEVLGCDADGSNYSGYRAHSDPFLRSMAYWMVKDHGRALSTLLDSETGHDRFQNHDDEISSYSGGPSVFNFYIYLRTHPLLIRQHLAITAQDKGKSVLMSGFTHSDHSSEQNVTISDKITPVERRLYFTTSHTHFKAGCPLLALEVLSKLPDLIDVESDGEQKDIPTIHVSDNSLPPSSPLIDWGAPVSTNATTNSAAKCEEIIDWSQPLTSNRIEDELDLRFDDSDTKSDTEVESIERAVEEPMNEETAKKKPALDIMAQQVKFIACLKIMMEELSTLATGFEVDGGQLRYQLYIWLEREVDCLRQICNYRSDITANAASESDEESHPTVRTEASQSLLSFSVTITRRTTLHEMIRAEKLNFQAKLERMAKRKQWLLRNQTLLRTLLSYCCLQGSSGGGLASVRMELILLLQELQQEKTQQQLLSPLPFPTTLPLLSASVASSKTVVADPIRHLQSLSRDLLHSITEFQSPPTCGAHLMQVVTLRNLSAALSACIYQCLCDSESVVVTGQDSVDIGMEGFTNTSVVYQDSYLMAGARRRRRHSTGEDRVTTAPAKWPGVTSLRALLARERDEESPKLNILLCESLIGVYMSLLIHALSTYDASVLYRLVAHPFSHNMWSSLFGGGIKKLIPSANTAAGKHGHVPRVVDENSKKRLNLNMRLFGPEAVQGQTDVKPVYKEKFIPPEQSILNYFMSKPTRGDNAPHVDYDSEASFASSDEDNDEEDGDEDEDERAVLKPQPPASARREHLDPNSYSWCVMRFAVIKLILNNVHTFLPQVGIELPELPVCSPLLHAALRILQAWVSISMRRMETFPGPPDNYIPGCYVDAQSGEGPLLHKYKTMLDVANTPFLTTHHTALPAKRLWNYLCRQEFLQDIFIRYIFKQKKTKKEIDVGGNMGGADYSMQKAGDAVKIIHKDQDVITAFCVNQANLNNLALSTTKELIEMDITSVLSPPVWLDDETEYDIEGIKHPMAMNSDADDFLVVSVPQDHPMLSPMSPSATPSAPGVVPAPTQMPPNQSGRGGSVITKRQIPGVRRMAAHPQLPYYLTGAQDGSVKLWEWGHNQCITVPRQSGTHSKVNKINFNLHGNKFGVADAEGSVCLWQVGLGVNMSKPYMSLKCHTKTVYDFAFAGSSSMIASGGLSSDGKNVCLWDTLLPIRSCCIQGFACHDQGCPALVYAPQHQVLISGGKKGEICIFDLRQRQLRHTFMAHDSAVRCLTLDPTEEFFVSGSSEGDLKVWGLRVHNQLAAFPGEHTKSSLFRNIGSSVMDVLLVPENHLYSCGADGALKVRTLPQRDGIVKAFI